MANADVTLEQLQQTIQAEKQKHDELVKALTDLKTQLDAVDQAHKVDLQKALQAQDDAWKAQKPAQSAYPMVVYPPSEKKLQKFWGNPFHHKLYIDVEDWIDDVDTTLDTKKGATEKELVNFIVSSLDGPAKAEVRLRGKDQWKTVDQVKDILRHNFGDKRTLVQRQHDFFNYKQSVDQSIRDYSHHLLKLLQSVFRADKDAFPNDQETMKAHFVENLQDQQLRRELRREMRDKPTISFMDLREEAVLWAEEERVDHLAETPDKPSKKTVSAKATDVSKDTQKTSKPQPNTTGTSEATLNDITKMMETFQKTTDALQKQLTDLKQEKRKPKDYSNYTCNYCHQKGHIIWKCDKKRADEAAASSTGTTSTGKDSSAAAPANSSSGNAT